MHDRVHETVTSADKPVFHVNGVLVPVDDPGRYGVQAKCPDELPVPDVGAALHRQAAFLADGPPQTGALVELHSGEIYLSQVSRIVHVEQQDIHVRGQARRRVRGGIQYVHILLE